MFIMFVRARNWLGIVLGVTKNKSNELQDCITYFRNSGV